MIKQLLLQASHWLAPRWTEETSGRLWFAKQARLLHRRCSLHGDLDTVLQEVFDSPWFPTLQKKKEFLELLKILRKVQPQRLCEIGGAGGGALFLFCQVAAATAKVLSIDVGYTPVHVKGFPYLARRGQKLTCLAADSHAPATLQKVNQWLAGQKLDFLFIDGDHSYKGVSSDFQMYAPYLRPGGLLAFHDIVPDYKTRYGVVSASNVGQVPRFWGSFKKQARQPRELIEDPNQDGYGIGLVEWNGKP